MDFKELLIPALWFALLGGVFGLILAIAARVFAVKVDERIPQITEALPGANCGGCGYSGCAAYAEAVVKGEAEPNRCAVGGASAAAEIAAVMGVEAGDMVPMRATVMCTARKDEATTKYLYEGAMDCVSATRLGGGERLCRLGCIGLGTCAAACPFGAITVEGGVARVDYDKCTGCGACSRACPKGLIRLIPQKMHYYVGCSSTAPGKLVRESCTKGCIGCRICEKKCPSGAIKVEDNRASINYTLCTDCGVCAESCPRHIILRRGGVTLETE